DHSNDSEALFFYENMQGDFEGQKKYDKVMQQEVKFGDTPIRKPGEPDYKDEVEYGTYIEVEGYYDASRNADRATQGPIKYRFMLGKNITYNYDAQRNHHYKLTLRLNGFANEADWHIDYVDEKPELNVPEYFYVSYLYGQGVGDGMPVRLAGNATSLKAEIIENNWAPYDESTKSVPASQHPGGDFYWNRQAYIDLDKTYNDNSYRGHCNFVGFLSLRKTTETTVNPGKLDSNGYGPNTMDYLKNFYLNRKQWYVGPVEGVPINEPGYDLSPTEPGEYHTIGSVANNDYLEYTVKKDEDGSVTVMVPMWTRAKSLGPMTGFSGNNPFVNYMRKAVVRFTATFVLSDGTSTTKTKDVPVFQVRRVVNPKAIWRSRGDDSEFNVTLTNLLTPDATSFSEFKSEGKWRVSVEKTLDGSGNSDWVEISLPAGTKPDENGYIYGSDNTPIKFKYKPSGVTSKDRFGIIKVEYNDYTCVHQIYVRQGYDEDIKISESSNTLWSSKNIYAFVSQTGSATTSGTSYATSDLSSISAIATESPLSMGTYFKRGNYDYGILESNNNTYGWNVSVQGRNLSTVHYTSATNKETRNAVWGNIWGVTNGVQDWKWARQIKVGSTNYRVPSYDDYNALLNRDVDFGYGVVYGDGAEDTQLPLANAYAFMDANNDGTTAAMKKNGVRCCIVYNGSTGHQILFPLSASGYGRRNCRPMTANSTNDGWAFVASNRGKLIYAGVIELLTNNLGSNNWYRPLNYNLLRNAGATYWINERRAGGHISDDDSSYAWDMNYFSYDFGGYDSSSLGGTADAARSSDALPIKLVR
ncbi:MAG: hypothetical protein K2K94_11355, partial [Muribaculaceae bacterium]|nr:hypothetical protein [Muribaculaceae bacterium]